MRTTLELYELCLRMQNCLADYHQEVSDGWMAIYEWRGEEPAAVMLIWDERFGWVLEEALGVANRELGCATRASIEGAIAAALQESEHGE